MVISTTSRRYVKILLKKPVKWEKYAFLFKYYITLPWIDEFFLIFFSEFVDQLKEQMTDANFNRTLMTQMFHSDFKQHLKAIDMLSRYIDADLEGLVANLDLILKWVCYIF